MNDIQNNMYKKYNNSCNINYIYVINTLLYQELIILNHFKSYNNNFIIKIIGLFFSFICTFNFVKFYLFFEKKKTAAEVAMTLCKAFKKETLSKLEARKKQTLYFFL